MTLKMGMRSSMPSYVSYIFSIRFHLKNLLHTPLTTCSIFICWTEIFKNINLKLFLSFYAWTLNKQSYQYVNIFWLFSGFECPSKSYFSRKRKRSRAILFDSSNETDGRTTSDLRTRTQRSQQSGFKQNRISLKRTISTFWYLSKFVFLTFFQRLHTNSCTQLDSFATIGTNNFKNEYFCQMFHIILVTKVINSS